MAAPPLLALQGIRLAFGATPMLEAAELVVAPGDRICLVGRNGSGKSTLMKIAAGELPFDGGVRFMQPDATIRYLPQEPDFSGYETTLAYAEAGLKPTDDPYRAMYLLNSLGLTGEEHPSRLSGGEGRRAALARVIAADPDVLLLDEPTNHLDLPAIEWLESEIAGLRSAVVIVSHDRRFLEDLTTSTVWLDRGRTRRLDRGFAHFEVWRDEVLAQEERDRHKLDRKIVDEEHWLRYGVTARRKRNQNRLAKLHDLRRERKEAKRSVGAVTLVASEAKASGALVIEAEKIAKNYGARRIVRDFSTRVLRGDRLGLVGANGAGKTTLVKLLTGALAPDAGEARLGANVEMATLDQGRAALDPDWTLQDALTGGSSDKETINGATKHVVGYMKDFLFAPEQARTPINRLSGGERGRLALARALSLPSNLLVLDEPTNDLDLETLELLQEMIADYPGTVLVVSHDREFLDRVATSVVVAEGEGLWREYAGGYSDMVAQRGAGVGSSPPEAKAKKPEPRPTPAPAAPRAEAKRKLSFKEKHALETLPARIEDLRVKSAQIAAALADPDLFARDRARFDKLNQAAAEVTQSLAKAEDEWLELELLREELEG
jgi:ATP-binding cassette subfamily F protein uup